MEKQRSKNFLFNLLLLLPLFVVVSAQLDSEVCPKKEDILPCSCDRDGISCMEATRTTEIARAFRAPAKQKAIRFFWLNGSPIKNITSNIFNGYKLNNIEMTFNELETVDNGAFKGSEKSLKTINMERNELRKFPFKDLAGFENLETVSFSMNKLEEIEERALSGVRVKTLRLSNNHINKIGRYAFQNATIRMIDLQLNELQSVGERAFATEENENEVFIFLAYNAINSIDKTAFDGLKRVHIDLSHNNLTYLEEETFEELLSRMAEQKSFDIKKRIFSSVSISLAGNPLTCKGCDNYRWLVRRKNLFNFVLTDFKCEDGTTLLELNEDYIGCH